MLDSWLPFLIYGFFALAIPLSMMFASFALSTKPHSRRTRGRSLPFESGVSEGPPEHSRFTISFYLKWFGFVEFLFFVVILALAYVYIWRKGALDWR